MWKVEKPILFGINGCMLFGQGADYDIFNDWLNNTTENHRPNCYNWKLGPYSEWWMQCLLVIFESINKSVSSQEWSQNISICADTCLKIKYRTGVGDYISDQFIYYKVLLIFNCCLNNPVVPFIALKNIKINAVIFLNYSWWIVMLDFRKDVEFGLIWQPVICVTNCPKHYIVHIAFFFFLCFFLLRVVK